MSLKSPDQIRAFLLLCSHVRPCPDNAADNGAFPFSAEIVAQAVNVRRIFGGVVRVVGNLEISIVPFPHSHALDHAGTVDRIQNKHHMTWFSNDRPFGKILPMKAPIVTELMSFFEENKHVSCRYLSQVSGVASPIITRVLSGERKDMTSRNADALRVAMKQISTKSDTTHAPEA